MVTQPSFTDAIDITPGELGVNETSNQSYIFSLYLSPGLNELQTSVILETNSPGEGQMAVFGPGVLSHTSGDAIILGSAQVTYNILGDNICSYASNITVLY